jgi:CubicO group peptidase (beta-lactamase class C family)
VKSNFGTLLLSALFSLQASLPSSASAFPAYDLAAVQRRLTEECGDGSFSGVLVVRAHGREIYSHTCGLADRERKVFITRDTRFRIFSTSKLLTALAVMRLSELKKIRLEAPISVYLDDVPLAWRGVTVKDLLQHTSGLPDETEALLGAWKTDHSAAMKVVLAEDRSKNVLPSFTHGDKWQYNNFNYELLAEACSRITRKPFQTVLRELVFDRAGMKSAIVEQPQLKDGKPGSKPDARLAKGYNGPADKLVPTDPYSFVQLGAGAVHANVDDFIALDRALTAGKVISPTTYAAMKASLRSPSEKNSEQGYGLGIMVRESSGVRHEGHDGGNNGYTSDFERFPEDDAMLVMLTNRGELKSYAQIRSSVAAALRAAR